MRDALDAFLMGMYRRATRRTTPYIFLSILALATGCRTVLGPSHHILLSDGRGQALNPEARGAERKPLSPSEYEKYIRHMFDEMNAFFEEGDKIGRPRKLLIFVHGGLNNEKSTIDRAARLSTQIREAGYYPIFVNWRSSLLSSYGYHLFLVRNGRYKPSLGIITSPFYIFADAVRAAGRVPVTTFQQGGEHVIYNWNARFAPHKAQWNQNYCTLRKQYEEALRSGELDHILRVSAGRKTSTFGEGLASTTSFIVKSPFKLALAPLIDAGGPAAWRIMKRRTELLFHSEEQLKTCCLSPSEGDGPLAVFLRQLRSEIGDACKISHSASGLPCPEITLVGHSMGAIVLNHVLTSFSDIRFSRIVYMAPACTVHEYEAAIWPYLQNNREAQFFLLTLDDFAELREAYVGDFVPRGSLLVWIDEFLTEPETDWGRTAGRFSNIMLTLPNTPEKIRDRIHVKTFGVGRSVSGPQGHGQFSEQSFWDPEFWQPDPVPSVSFDLRCARSTKSF